MVDVAEQHPLKQGLKQNQVIAASTITTVVAEQHPLKQGLKPKHSLPVAWPGPRRRATSTKTRIETSCSNIIYINFCGRRATSTKTRIETYN